MTGPLPDRRFTVGLGLFTGQRPHGASRPPYADAPLLARAAEDAGFDAFWVSEHHGWADGHLPAPLPLLAGIATATSTIALAAGVVLAPLHHPVRLAEDAAVVDQLSGGRLLLGLGLGYDDAEYATFGVPPQTRGERLTDLLGFLRRAWRGEPFDWAGPAHPGTGLVVTPPPVRGAVPIWLGGYAPAALRRAAALGDGYLLGRADPEVVDGVVAALGERRGDPGFVLGLNLLVLLTGDGGDGGDTGDGADERSARAGFAAQQTAYERVQRGRRPHAGRVAEPGDEPVGPADVDRYLQAAGPPAAVAEQVAARLERLGDWPRVHVVLRALFPEPDVAVQVRRVERLGREVVAVLRRS